MNNNEKLIDEARRLTVIDRISSEPVVAMLGRLVDALEAAETQPICPQPCTHLSQEDSREGRTCPEHPCTCRKPQGEPSEAQVEIAWRTYEGISPKTFVMGPAIGKARERMRAALSAAGGVQ